MLELNKLYNMDCMEGMASFPDKYFDIAIVDPPYGIDMMNSGGYPAKHGFTKWERKSWDKHIPTAEYFKEMFRVSENQIIWGGNYFTEFLPPSSCWIMWDKGQRDFTFADGELAWASFKKALRIFTYSRSKTANSRAGIHPTEKPIALYSWLLSKFAKPGNKIIDTHAGSASSLIACHNAGNEFIGFEIDGQYYEAANERLIAAMSQMRIDEVVSRKPEMEITQGSLF